MSNNITVTWTKTDPAEPRIFEGVVTPFFFEKLKELYEIEVMRGSVEIEPSGMVNISFELSEDKAVALTNALTEANGL